MVEQSLIFLQEWNEVRKVTRANLAGGGRASGRLLGQHTCAKDLHITGALLHLSAWFCSWSTTFHSFSHLRASGQRCLPYCPFPPYFVASSPMIFPLHHVPIFSLDHPGFQGLQPTTLHPCFFPLLPCSVTLAEAFTAVYH
jgi:hypothetical protein